MSITLKQGQTFEASFLPEPATVILFQLVGESFKLISKGERSGDFFDRTITLEQLKSITIIEENPYKGDAKKAKIAIEALRIGLAYEYDPYFTLSISRIDPLPHQLEAVYDYFLKTPRIRFLLADDPGAGTTIMAGLLIKELKTRGLVKRILILTPANLTFQWQRELKDKFRESFEIIDMYARNLSEDVITDRIIEEIDTDRMRKITNSTVEGLAKRELNLSAA